MFALLACAAFLAGLIEQAAKGHWGVVDVIFLLLLGAVFLSLHLIYPIGIKGPEK